MREPSKPERGSDPTDNDDVVRFDLRQAADFMGISPQRLNVLRWRGEIPARRVGLLGWSFRKPDLTAYVAGAAEPAPSRADVPSSAASTKITVNPRLMSPDVPEEEARPASESPLIRMANAILVSAIEHRASEIYLEPDQSEVRIRFRIDGELQPFMAIPRHIQAPLIARYKVMGDMVVQKQDIAQRGSVAILHNGANYQIRIACIPSLYGESLMMAILATEHIPTLADLGLSPEAQEALGQILRAPGGLVLFAGPPGSGLTTTAVSCLQRLVAANRTISSWEEVREYTVSGVTRSYRSQTKVAAAGDGVRALLDQKPDILFVGDIRDADLAQATVDAALAGTLVLATIPALDPFDAVRRLATFGVDRGLAARALAGVCAQRLVRRVCPTCQMSDAGPAAEFADFPNDPSGMVELFREPVKDDGHGHGRTGLFEVQPFDAALADRIARGGSDAELRAAASAAGLVGFRADATRKVTAGETSLDEVTRALHRVH